MSSQEEIKRVLQLMQNHRPFHTCDSVAEHNMGILGVMKVLYHKNSPIRSKDISDALGISTARMAVLLKKLEAKGYIEKTNGTEDARVTLVALSPQGQEFAKGMYETVCKTAESLIDEFGIDYLERLLSDMTRVKEIMNQNRPNF